MDKLDLHPRIIRALGKARITKPRSVLETSMADLSRSTKLSLQDVDSLVKTISEKIPRPTAVTALDLYKKQCHELQNVHKLSMGCTTLDSHLRGGILSQGITEIVGESSSGKTQVCLQLCLAVQLPCHLGGLDGAAVFISTEDVFPSKRLQQLIPAFEQKYRAVFKSRTSVGDNIFIEHAADIEALMNLIRNRLPALLTKMQVKLVVIDSIAALFRVEYTFQEMIQRSKVMNTIGAQLKELSYQHNVPVVCVNQVSAVMNDSVSSSNQNVTPCLGLTWSNLVTVRLMLSRPWGHTVGPVDQNMEQSEQCNSPRRELKVVFAPHLPNITCPFTVDKNGVHGLAE